MKNKINIPPFYVGQEVVAIRKTMTLTKGADYVVSDVMKCACGNWVVCVGQIWLSGLVCGTCDRIIFNRGLNYDDATIFRPKLEISAFISMKEVADVEIFSVN